MNILVVQESDWMKRNPHQQHHLMERLSLKGHNIKVIDYEIHWKTNKEGLISPRQVFKGVHKIHDEARIDIIRPTLVKIPVLNYFSWIVSNWKEINRQIKEFKPDIIVGFGLINTYLASRAAKKHKIPFVYYLIDVLYNLIPEKTFQFMGKQVQKGIIKNSDLIITINKRLAESVIELGSQKKKTIVIEAGVDLNKFNPQLDGTEIRKQYGIKKDELVLFFMGWIYHFAGVKEVAEGIGKHEYKNLKFMVVGDGDAFQDLVHLQKKYQMYNQLILTGKQPYDKIPEFIAASDICILPSYPDEVIMQDIVPIKIYEYMAMGKPVITTELPGIKKEFGEDNGLIYADKPIDLIKIAKELDIQSYGRIAREYVKNNDWDSITSLFENNLLKLS